MDNLDDREEDLEPCKFCNSLCDARTMHLHQDQFVGECCWDERLRVTE